MLKRAAFTKSALFALIALGVAGVSNIAAQSGERVVVKQSYPNEPLLLSNMRVKQQEVKFEREFTADDEWIRDFSIEIQNVSGQAIRAIEVLLVVKYIGGERRFALPLQYGALRVTPLGSDMNTGVAPIKAGEKVLLTVDKDAYQTLRNRLQDPQLSSIVKGTVAIQSVLLEDNSLWTAGQRLIRVSEDEWKPSPSTASPADSNADNDGGAFTEKPTTQAISNCQCGGAVTVSVICCQTESCAVIYYRQTIDCNVSGNYRCEAVDSGTTCHCFPGNVDCGKCLYIDCSIG